MPDEQRERGLGGPSRTARRRCRSPYPPQSRPESSRSPAAAELASLEVEPHSRAAERHHAKHAVDARRVLAGHPIERPAFQLVPDMLSETDLPQVESLQARAKAFGAVLRARGLLGTADQVLSVARPARKK